MIRDADLTLEKPAMIDVLTGVGNRLAFDQALEDQWGRHRDVSASLGLILMDVDALKSYNATLDRAAGDDCLREVARTIRGAVRKYGGLVARYGGGVFAAILPETDRTTAAEVVRGVVESLQGRALAHPSSPTGPVVTLSLGIATLVPEPDLSPGVLVDQAERSLALAKVGGRNLAVHFPS
jgi:diguanylate cyclase (GGDEF)-like protein